MSKIHKRFSCDEVKELLERYLKKKIERKYIQEILGIGKSRFFMLISLYREDPQRFTTHYERNTPARISKEIEHNIVKELSIEKGIIENKEIPLKSYNYSFIKDRLRKKYRQKVSLTTIIRRAKTHGFYLKKTPWAHILALQTVILQHGLPYCYYVDSHSIFRFVQGRDSLWRKHHLLTDEATPQWKQVLDDCNVKVTYALSPQAKGKMERPYGWLQDRLV